MRSRTSRHWRGAGATGAGHGDRDADRSGSACGGGKPGPPLHADGAVARRDRVGVARGQPRILPVEAHTPGARDGQDLTHAEDAPIGRRAQSAGDQESRACHRCNPQRQRPKQDHPAQSGPELSRIRRPRSRPRPTFKAGGACCDGAPSGSLGTSDRSRCPRRHRALQRRLNEAQLRLDRLILADQLEGALLPSVRTLGHRALQGLFERGRTSARPVGGSAVRRIRCISSAWV